MRSQLQILASRANGAKSHGPVTPQGQLASTGNRLDHGLLAEAIALDGEAADRLAALSLAFHELLQPRNEIELNHVENMIMCRWRQMRLWILESANMAHEIRKQALLHQFESKSTRAALAFRRLADESLSLELINRYETRFHRQFIRAHKCFLEVRANPDPPETLEKALHVPAPVVDAAPQEPQSSEPQFTPLGSTK